VIDLQTTNHYEANSLITITVLERTPPMLPDGNDCDFDGTPDGILDCDSDGTQDLPVKATSEAELEGELVYANLVAGSTDEYKADLPISSNYDVDGVLFVQPVGTDQATVTVLYMDMDDGTGTICQNDVDPAGHGRVEASTSILLTRGDVRVLHTVLSDNGDDDGWADTNETVDMQIVVGNKTGVDLSGLTARLTTNDPKIECIISGQVYIGDLEADSEVLSGEAFTFRVADVQREGTCSIGGNTCTTDVDCTGGGGDTCDADLIDFSAEFTVILSAEEFETTIEPEVVTLDLDLDASGGSGPYEYVEGFESGTFGTFTSMNIDDGKNSNAASQGYRCQYSDPEWEKSNSYGQISDCWLAASPTQATQFFWETQDGDASFGTSDSGKAYLGRYSAYMGLFDTVSDDWTTPLAQLEALASIDPVNIGWDRVCETTRTIACTGDGDCPGGESCVGVIPELSFKHQISLPDSRVVGTGPFESADGAIVAVQLAAPDAGGTPVGDWIKVEPYLNVYDQQRTDNYTNCFFDPIDDGTTEDDFFDPTDPDRRLGPSSMCFPEFVFVRLGDTDQPFAEDNINLASDGPGLEGNKGVGTWVESKFSLERFRGRRLRIRFMDSAIKAGSFENIEALFEWNPLAADDGWWVDDIRIRDALATYATVVTDTKPNTGLPGCGAACSTLTADLAADPPGALAAPGQVVELSAVGSSADSCLNGTLQYRFCIDADADIACDGPADMLLRGWTDNPVLLQAPANNTDYVVEVRCSSAVTCADAASLTVSVNCPATAARNRSLGVFGPSGIEPVGWLYAYGGTCSDDPEEFCTLDTDCDAGVCEDAAPGEMLLSWDPGFDKGRRVRITETGVGDGTDLQQTKSSRAPSYVTIRLVREACKGYADPLPDPSPGNFYWYLMRHADEEYCNVGGSWQSGGPTAETERDDQLP
jgi:hypothetical protein